MRYLVLFFTAIVASFAAPREFASPETRVHLIELFTSEGCSSCPPAEAWLGNLREQRGLWRDFVPIAWHVDYWDRLGWKDRFARRDATQRQYAYAEGWRSGTVYTPCFVLDGREWRTRDRVPAASPDKAGRLRATWEQGKLSIAFDASDSDSYTVHAALLGSDITSKVTRGENSGRRLNHEFVALEFKQAPLRSGRSEIELPAMKPSGVGRVAIAVWLTRGSDLTPVQATGGWLD